MAESSNEYPRTCTGICRIHGETKFTIYKIASKEHRVGYRLRKVCCLCQKKHSRVNSKKSEKPEKKNTSSCLIPSVIDAAIPKRCSVLFTFII